LDEEAHWELLSVRHFKDSLSKVLLKVIGRPGGCPANLGELRPILEVVGNKQDCIGIGQVWVDCMGVWGENDAGECGEVQPIV